MDTTDNSLVNTANGAIPFRGDTSITQRHLEYNVNAKVLQGECPPLISVGKWCNENGYSFHWKPWAKKHIFRDSQRRKIPLRVQNFIPHLLPEPDPQDLAEEEFAAVISRGPLQH